MDGVPVFFSPRPSSVSFSSSDLDTQSTGSFFPERSTTLATLIGITFSESSFRLARLPSQRQDDGHGHGDGGGGGGGGGDGGSGRGCGGGGGGDMAVLQTSLEERFLDPGVEVAEDVAVGGLLPLAGVRCSLANSFLKQLQIRDQNSQS